jgi:hypothetical protein
MVNIKTIASFETNSNLRSIQKSTLIFSRKYEAIPEEISVYNMFNNKTSCILEITSGKPPVHVMVLWLMARVA